MIVGGLAIALALCLVALPWFDIGFGITLTATDGPDGWLGILAFLVALAVVADLAIENFSPQTQIPPIGGSRANTRFILAAITAGFVALKFLFHIHFSLFGWGFYVTVLVTAALVYFSWQLRAGMSISMPRMGSSSGPPPPPPSGPSDAGAGSGGSTPPPGA
jgi:hypothetical protein